jgi:transcriptional regulator with XRE-family HTH domain
MSTGESNRPGAVNGHGAKSAPDRTTDVWQLLAESMRELRLAAGRSLRQVEQSSGWGRGMLSQAETGRARPSRRLVEWYDDQFHADGLLLRMLVEARTADTGVGRGARERRVRPGDSLQVLEARPARGLLVAPGDVLDVAWTIENAGFVPWTDRAVRRVGATAGAQLVASPPSVPLPDAAPRDQVEVGFPVTVPQAHGMVVAYWDVVDAEGKTSFPGPPLLSLVLVVEGR